MATKQQTEEIARIEAQIAELQIQEQASRELRQKYDQEARGKAKEVEKLRRQLIELYRAAK